MKFRKYEDIVQSKEDLLFEQLLDDTFYGIDEGILQNIKKIGLWKGLKLSLGKTVGNLLKYIKDNPKLKKDFASFAKNVGSEAAEDAGKIIGEISKGYEAKIAKLQQEMEALEDKVKA